MSALALLEGVHGHFGVLAAAVLAHPAIRLRRGAPLSNGARWASSGAGLLVAAAFATGLWIYPRYVALVRPRLFGVSERAALLFETKEHLALMTVATALGAVACVWLARREDRDLRRGAALLFALSSALCLTVVALGTYIASVQTFAR
ncbi:MAG: hypothetical protein HY908_20650 [Myxococcales bacterium]|nr:hypothetical protein [Myxococcales bacterium]